MISKDSVLMKQYKNSLKINLDELLSSIIERHKKEIIDLQKEQLKFGLASDGKKISPSYKGYNYAYEKNQQNPFPGLGTPDLYKTGKMHKNLDLQVGVPSDNEYTIYSDVDYFNDLIDKYVNPMGLTKKSIKNLPIIQEEFFKELHILLNK